MSGEGSHGTDQAEPMGHPRGQHSHHGDQAGGRGQTVQICKARSNSTNKVRSSSTKKASIGTNVYLGTSIGRCTSKYHRSKVSPSKLQWRESIFGQQGPGCGNQPESSISGKIPYII